MGRPTGATRLTDVRIALLTDATRPGGGAVHALSLADALVALGEEVTVVTPAAPFRRLDPRVRLQHSYDPADFDIVHAHEALAVEGGVRTVHEPEPEPAPAALYLCGAAGIAAAVEREWGVAARVVPAGVRAGRFAVAAGQGAARERARWRSRFGSGQLILTVGTLEPDLLEAVARLGRGHRLVVAGDGDGGALEARAAELDVSIALLGPVAHEKYPELVACADAFALAPVAEGSAVAALEALAAAVPLVLRGLPAFRRRFAGAARFGTTPAELARALEAALGDESHAQRVAGRALAARRSWGAAAREHQALYRELLGARTRRRTRAAA